MCKKRGLAAVYAAILITVAACGGGGSSNVVGGGALQLGDPLPTATQAQVDAFMRGRAVFEREFKPSDGLGPLYNAASCKACHNTPVMGGAAPRYRNFFLAAVGLPSAQGAIPGLPSRIIPSYGAPPHAAALFTLEGGRQTIPNNVFGSPVTAAQRNSIPIFGVGLFETISDATILSNADPNDADGDGISGRANMDVNGAVGRFGLKAQANNIEIFTRAPLQNQMGITTVPFLGAAGTISLRGHAAPFQGTLDPNDPTTDNDGVADPEMSTQDLGDLIAFSRFLAPPQKKAFSAAAMRGEMLFDQLGCTKCHIPSLPGSDGPVEAFTDLLLHDMGPALADGLNFGIPQASTIPPVDNNTQEFRTQPLWGVSSFPPFLHDGRADTLDEAIQLHGGEAETIKLAYQALPQMDRDDIIAFLEAL